MSERVKIINNRLEKTTSVPILIPFPVIAIPINNKGCVEEVSKATGTHYATFVFNLIDKRVYVLHFDEQIRFGISAYMRRGRDMKRFAILASKENDGRLRITSGYNIEENLIGDELYGLYLGRVELLYEKIIKRVGWSLIAHQE